MIPVILSQIYPPEMAMSGYVAGDMRRYALGGSHSGYEIDSIISVDNTTMIGCILPLGSQIVTIKSWNPDSFRVDTFYAYYNTFYLVEFFKKPYFGIKARVPGMSVAIRSLKFPIMEGDRWPAYDWCGVRTGNYYDVGDLDGNGRTDSIVFIPSEMRYTYVSPDTDTVITAGVINYVFLYSFWDTVRSLGDTILWILYKRAFYYHDYIHFIYVKNVGYVEYEVDSSITTYYTYLYSVNDSFVAPLISLDSVDTSYSLYSRTRRPLNATERKGIFLTVKGRRVLIRCSICPYSVYDAGGRRVASGTAKGETTIPLRTGVYFVRLGDEIKRVVVR